MSVELFSQSLERARKYRITEPGDRRADRLALSPARRRPSCPWPKSMRAFRERELTRKVR